MKRMLAIGAVLGLCGCTGDKSNPLVSIEPRNGGVIISKIGVVDGCDAYRIADMRAVTFVLRCPCGVAVK